jgi:hypothetical protein
VESGSRRKRLGIEDRVEKKCMGKKGEASEGWRRPSKGKKGLERGRKRENEEQKERVGAV